MARWCDVDTSLMKRHGSQRRAVLPEKITRVLYTRQCDKDRAVRVARRLKGSDVNHFTRVDYVSRPSRGKCPCSSCGIQRLGPLPWSAMSIAFIPLKAAEQ